jgi:enterochelin esterase-like enzyme
LPPQYGDPAYRNRRFPVIELVPGYPGHPRNWVEQFNVAAVLDQAIASGHVSPLIAVMPTSTVTPPRDTECVNVPGGPQVETYLTTDVPDAITRAFRAQPISTGWALMGYSTGGYCSVNLALRHPGHYRAAVSLAGYNAPANDRTTGDLFAGDSALRDQNTTLWRVQHLPPPVLSLLLMDTADDKESFSDDRALAAAAVPPLHVSVISLAHGGHNFTTWRAEELTALSWLSAFLTPPLAPIPAVNGQTPQ